MNWSPLIFDCFAIPFAAGIIWYSLETGSLAFGAKGATRADSPGQFWFWIGFVILWCIVVLYWTVPKILAGL